MVGQTRAVVGVAVHRPPAAGRRSGGGAPWTEPVPESVNVLPAIGRNFQS